MSDVTRTDITRIEAGISKLGDRMDAFGERISAVETTSARAAKDIENMDSTMRNTAQELSRVTVELKQARQELTHARTGKPAADADEGAFHAWLVSWREFFVPRNLVATALVLAVIVGMVLDAWKGDLDRAELMDRIQQIEHLSEDIVPPESPVEPEESEPEE